jgi:hypothetical protein
MWENTGGPRWSPWAVRILRSHIVRTVCTTVHWQATKGGRAQCQSSKRHNFLILPPAIAFSIYIFWSTEIKEKRIAFILENLPVVWLFYCCCSIGLLILWLVSAAVVAGVITLYVAWTKAQQLLLMGRQQGGEICDNTLKTERRNTGQLMV